MKNKTVGIMAAATLLIGGAYMLNAKDRDSDRSDKTKRIYITYMKLGASEELVDAHVNGLAKVAPKMVPKKAKKPLLKKILEDFGDPSAMHKSASGK